MKLRGKLVRILGGAEWDILTDEGHAGLMAALRKFEGQEVVLTVVLAKRTAGGGNGRGPAARKGTRRKAKK